MFMQKSAIRLEKEKNEDELQRIIDDEHWVLDIPELEQKESKYITDPSYVRCADLKFGRMSFKGFNLEIERLNKSQNQEAELAAAEVKEKEDAVSDDEMTERYKSLVSTIAKKYSKKRKRTDMSSEDTGARSEFSTPPTEWKFMKPSDD